MIDPMSLRQTPGVHTLSDAVSIEWLDDGKINIITVQDMRRETIDVYREANIAIMKAWDPTQIFLTVQDVSSDKIAMTPYARESNALIWKTAKETSLYGMNCILMRYGWSLNSLIKFYVNTANRLFPSRLQVVFEVDRASALNRLRRLMESDTTGS